MSRRIVHLTSGTSTIVNRNFLSKNWTRKKKREGILIMEQAKQVRERKKKNAKRQKPS